MKTRQGFTLLEIMPVLTVVVVLSLIVILALNPQKQFEGARNRVRQQHINLIAESITSFTQNKSTTIFTRISTGAAMEICGDALTGSCTHLLDLRPLMPHYMSIIPIDPTSGDSDALNEHTRYFISRRNNHITVTAPDTEPLGSTDVSVSRIQIDVK